MAGTASNDGGTAAKTVAQVGAAIGRDFSHELLAAAAPLAEPELQEALRRLVEAGFVFQRGVPPTAEYGHHLHVGGGGAHGARGGKSHLEGAWRDLSGTIATCAG